MTITRPIQARNLEIEVIEETTAAAFKTAVNDWFAAAGEKELIAFEAEITAGAEYVAHILYTE